MTIREHISLLQAKHGELQRIHAAPTAYPESITQTPTVLVYAGPGSTWMHAFATGTPTESGMQSRTYNVHVYVAPAGSGKMETDVQLVNSLLDDFQRLYLRMANNGLTGNPALYPQLMMDEEKPASDTGSGYMDYGKQVFHGFEFNVTITDEFKEDKACPLD